MNRILKLLRGIVGMGLTFAAGLSGVFSVIVVAKWLLFGADLRFEMIETVLTGAAPAGFLIGATFAGGVAVYGRRRSFDEISFTSFAALGATAGLVLSLVLGVPLPLLTLLGAGTAVGALALARTAEPALPDSEDKPILPEERRS